MKKIKIAIWGINVILIAVILFLVLGNGMKNDTTNNYKTYTVQRDNADYFNGIVQENDKHAVSDQPKSEDETLTATHVMSGQKVTKGQVLFTFSRDMSSDIASVNAEIQQAQLAIQAYSSNTATSTTTSTDAASAAETQQTAQQTATANKIELSKDQAALAEAQAKLAKLNQAQSRTVVAPISGTYFKDEAGRSFIYGTPVIEGNVNEYSLDKIKVGGEVTVIKNNGQKISGNYEQKDVIPYSTQNVSYYHFRVATEDKLPYGMHVQIKTASDGYKIPSKAIWKKNTVYVLKNDKKHKRHVTMTKKDQEYYVIDGLKAGDKLVLK